MLAFLYYRSSSNNIQYLRSFSTSVYSNNSNPTVIHHQTTSQIKSKRQEFREILPDYAVLNKLDNIRLGFNSKRKQRIAVARKFGNSKHAPPRLSNKFSPSINIKELRRNAPYPFKKIGVPLLVADDYSDIPRAFPGNDEPPEIG